MRLLTSEQMRKADEYTIKELGVPSQTLMERAGAALAEKALEMLGEKSRVACVCGGGNNGGDGFVCARFLLEKGMDGRVVCTAEKFSKDCAIQQEKYLAAGGKIETELSGAVDLIVDCLLGTGFQGEPRAVTALQIKKINAQKERGVKVLSADLPSGLNGTNGLGTICVEATETLCIGEVKTGAVLQNGLDCCGKLSRVDIGIARGDFAAETVEKEYVYGCLPKRKRNTHKGTFGKAVIIGGSKAYLGAPYLSASAALKSGAGYVSLCVPEGIFPFYALKSPELLLKTIRGEESIRFNEKDFKELLSANAIAFGMGAGVSQDVAETAAYLVENYTGRLVLDADALNSIAQYLDVDSLFAKKRCDIVITPHVKEFSRLTKKSVQELVKAGVAAPKGFAEKWGITILLKGASTIVASAGSLLVNTRGTAGQAKGGSGDVLSGVIASLCAQGLSAFDGAACGAWLTGVAAELAEKNSNEYSLTPSCVIESLPFAFSARV